MKDNKLERVRQSVSMLRQQFLQSDAGVFDQVLGEQEIAAMVSEQVESYRERVYSPLETLRLFIGQALSTDRACQELKGSAPIILYASELFSVFPAKCFEINEIRS